MTRRPFAALFALPLVALACASTPRTPPPLPPPVAASAPCPSCPAGPAPAPPPSRAEPAAPSLIASATADFDGDGAEETVRLDDRGVFSLARSDGNVAPNVGDVSDFSGLSMDAYRGHGGPLTVIDLDRRDRRRELLLSSMRGDEDPDPEYRVFFLHGGRLVSMLERTGTDDRGVFVPHGTRPAVRGDGVMRFRFRRCARDGGPDGAGGAWLQTDLWYVLADHGLGPGTSLVENVRNAHVPGRCVFAG